MPQDQPGHGSASWISFAIVSLGIVLHMVLISWAGFVLASTMLYLLIARGFDSRRPTRDLLIGLVLALAAYFLFTMALGLRLPPFPIGGI